MDNQQKLILTGKICPYCFRPTEYVDSSEIYSGNKNYGMFYLCRPCKAWVGVHRKTSQKALGRLADRDLRKLKMQAHDFFDFLWKRKMEKGISKKNARHAAYDWLSKELGIERELTHIGMFDNEQCKMAIELCRPHFNRLTK